MDKNSAILKSERLWEGLFDQAPDAILVANDSGVLERVNDQTCFMFGYKKDELIGQKIELLVPERYRENHPAHRDAYMTNPHTRPMAAGLELYGRRKDGSEIPVDIMLSPLNTEERKFVIAIIRDITDRRRIEQERERLTQQREDFVATLTHDLKTPILAANRALKLLLDGDFGKVPEQQRSLIQTILDSNDNMYTMVRTLLEVYKYDSGTKRLAFEYHDFSKLINQVVMELNALAIDQEIKLVIELNEDLEPVHCDIEEIRRVFHNLISNALKFTKSNGIITIRVCQNEGITEATVTDTGKGISETDKAKLFQRFWQASQERKYYASTGLGLYLCRRIIELHGGEIWCHSELGKGSTFGFAIPTLPVLEEGNE